VASGKTTALLGFLRAHDIAILDFHVCLQTRLRDFEELYKFNLTRYNEQNMLGSWWLNNQVYMAGASVAVLVFQTVPSNEGVHTAVGRLKGASSPFLAMPGELRYDLKASNRSINLIHTADDPLSTAREVLLFQSPDWLRRALATYAAVSTNGHAIEAHQREIDARLALELGALDSESRSLDFLDVLTRLRMRMWNVLRSSAKGLSPNDRWDAKHAAASAELQRIVSAPECTPLDRYRNYMRASEYGDTLLSSWEGELAKLLATLSRPTCWNFETSELCVALFRRYQIHLTLWERLVLETSLFYIDDLWLAMRKYPEASDDSTQRPRFFDERER
jgi:nucleoside diphosphate kinase